MKAQNSPISEQLHSICSNGIFRPEQLQIGDAGPYNHRYLIVSCGGIGAKVLHRTKQLLKKHFSDSQLSQHVRFLAVDTDDSTPFQTIISHTEDDHTTTQQQRILEEDEFFHLSCTPMHAHLCATPFQKSPADWLSPNMVYYFRQFLSVAPQGGGANGIRQFGRFHLYLAENMLLLQARISNLVSQLTNGTVAPLRVIILSGLAGGTGSGTVIDLTYLIRDIISNMPGFVGMNTEYLGFLMLPSTGSSKNPDDITHGNRNGYATLKEIDHYMTLQQRNKCVEDHDKREKYTFTYSNGYTVTSDSNLFSLCFLLDGNMGYVTSEYPLERCAEAVSQYLLASMVSTRLDGIIHWMDKVINDEDTFRMQMLCLSSPDREAPRDANYAYCSLGYSQFSLPTDLLKHHLFSAILEQIRATYLPNLSVEPEDASDFVKMIAKQRPDTPSETTALIRQSLASVIRKPSINSAGLPYAVQLLRCVINDTIPQLRSRFFPLFPRYLLDYIDEAARHLLTQRYEPMLSTLRSLCRFTIESPKPDSNIFANFVPTSLNDPSSTASVLQRLCRILSPELCAKVYNQLIDCLTQAFDDNRSDFGIAPMQQLLNHMQELNLPSFQTLLYSYLAKDPSYWDLHLGAPHFTDSFRKLSKDIYYALLHAPALNMPMLYTRFTSQNMVGHTFILVPKSAPQLLEALREIAKEESAGGNPVSVIASNAVDTITCYRHFTAIPAFNLNWTPQAELVYESALLQHSHEELHSSETHNGIPWQVYPNLQPMSTRGSTLFGCSNPRETELTQQAEGLFQWALKIPGMTRYESHGDIRYYSIALLPQAYRPDESLFIRLYREPPVFIPDIREEIKRSAAAIADGLFLPNLTTDENLLDALAAQGIPCEYRSLNIAPLLTYYPANEAPNDWPETVAATMLRKLPSILPALEGTLMVLDALYSRKRSSL